jgi:hypothetical protein
VHALLALVLLGVLLLEAPTGISDRFVSYLLRHPEVGAVAADLPDARLLALA